uniref:Uncharacterized protein n=1 Tax=Streptomyces longisporoflavus TaxID=28044 RepID=D7F1J9_9ACTN|nr:conserved hypothetical protein [Streptomyces longisporoflavus]
MRCTAPAAGAPPRGRTALLPGHAPALARRRLADDLGVPVSAGLDRPPLRRVVDMDEAEPLVVAVRPLEVVQQRPREVPGQRHPLAYGTRAGRQMLLQIAGALRVVDRAVVPQDVRVGRAVLGDVHALCAVLLGQPHQQLLQAVRVHLPVHRRVAHARQIDLLGVRRGPGRVVGDDLAEVVVQPQPVQRRGDGLQIAGALGQLHPVQVEHVLRVAAPVDRVQPPAVDVTVGPHGRRPVRLAVGGRLDRTEVVHDADTGVGGRRADGLDGETVTEVQMVRGVHRGLDVGETRRHPSLQMADPRGAQRLVEGRPVLDPVAQTLGDDGGVGGEVLGRLAGRPAAAVLERLREVPVVERGEGGDARLQQAVHQPVVEGDPGLVHRPVPAGDDTRPGEREAVRADPEPLHEADVLGHPVVVVTGDVPGVAVVDLARGVGEGVPDRGRAAVLGDGALDLIGGCGDAPEEIVGEGVEVVH